jgi:hypothetical protein
MPTSILSHEGDILRRVFRPEQGDVPAAVAHWLLSMDLAPEDHSRVAELLDKGREGTLTPEEDAELEDYGDVGRMLELLKAKAHTALREADSRNGMTTSAGATSGWSHARRLPA